MREFPAVMCVARRDVRLQMVEGLARARNLLRQAANLPADVVLLVEVRGAQLVELADFGVDFDLFHHGRIAGGDGLDFGVGERAAFEILGGAHRDVCPLITCWMKRALVSSVCHI